MRPLPLWTPEHAEWLHAHGWLTDAGYKTFCVCRRFVELRAGGTRRGEAILLLMDEFNLSDSRIEEMLAPQRKRE